MSNIIIDSNFEPHDVILQNPDRPAPPEVLHAQGLMQVTYYGFDGKVHQGQIVMATHIIADVDAFFRQAYEMQFPFEMVVPVSAPQYRWDGKKVLEDNLTSGYDYRTAKRTGKLSAHAQGLAMDVNPRQNPFIRYTEEGPIVVPEDGAWNPAAPGTLHAEHPLVKLMEGFGWEWGGHWTPDSGRTDYMHLQKLPNA